MAELTGKKFRAIAIDGPSYAGKTTLAKELARQLGFIYISTDMLCRALAVHKLWMKRENGLPVSNETALRTFSVEFKLNESGEQEVTVWSEPVNQYLYSEEVTAEAYEIGVDQATHAALLEFQRRQALCYDVVMDGKDIGTSILPNADVKIYLKADVVKRAYRRYRALLEAGETVDYCSVVDEIRAKDWYDCTKAASPLKPAYDAIELNNSDMTFAQTVERALGVVKQKLGV